jgi:hypothetical protein
MNELWKLREAEHFFARLRAAEAARDDEVFAFELSAFLSAARSALLYAMEEAGLRGRLEWYESAVGNRRGLRFLADERNTNIHWQPVSPIRIESVPPAEAAATGPSLAYYFLEWEGTETAVDLCEVCLAAIRDVLAEGQAEGILTRQQATFLSPVQLEHRRAEAKRIRSSRTAAEQPGAPDKVRR